MKDWQDKFLNKVVCGDCLELIKEIPNKSVDLVLIDPPYSINYKSNYGSKEYQHRIQTAQEWDNNFDFSIYFNDIFRVLKEDGYMYVFGRFENYDTMKMLGMVRVLVWDKDYTGMGDLSDWGIAYELIYVFKKGKPYLRGKRINGCIKLQHIGYFDKTLHPTQKPLNIIRLLIEKSTDNKGIVLDCFLGSGTTAVACMQLNRNFIGIDISPEYCKIAEQRLKAVPEKLMNFNEAKIKEVEK
jgi:site-specific DNA-methyltransferase (adenine-specific)